MIEWIAQHIFEKYNYWISIVIMLIGFYAMIAKENLLKKLIGLSIFQTAIFLFYISLSDIGTGWGLRFGTAPIIWEQGIHEGYMYVNPLPHVLMLTGIVVSAATLAVALALVVRLYEEYGTIEEEEILEMEMGIERGT
ncbi:MAG TPA: cation:proton antiporter subunit C [Candidatus Bathyarchaeia archaeon]|nr:cation:proton antiporter subunit C [Candidatus Bathyarchaeia archaeon]